MRLLDSWGKIHSTSGLRGKEVHALSDITPDTTILSSRPAPRVINNYSGTGGYKSA